MDDDVNKNRCIGMVVALTAFCFVALPSAADADYETGLAAFDSGNFAKAFEDWREEAEKENPMAQHGLALLYETGKGVALDMKAAAALYEKAASHDYAPAMNNLARMLEEGRGVDQDRAKAITLWQRAADLGNPEALYNLGLRFAEGAGVEKNEGEAARYLLAAAKAGVPEAQYRMALMARAGSGIAADGKAADIWLRMAASAGYAPAKAELLALADSTEREGPWEKSRGKAEAQEGQLALDAGNSAATAPAIAGEAPRDRWVSIERPGSNVYRIWIGQAIDEGAARKQWMSQQQRFSSSLAVLVVDLRHYEVAGKGSLYRIFAGPFTKAEEATKICQRLVRADANQFCRVVTN